MRNKIIIISKKLAGLCFFGVFASIITLKAYGIDPKFSVFFFIGALFFFALTALPTGAGVKSFSSWILSLALMFAVIGISSMFIPLAFLGGTLQSGIVMIGAVFFMLAVLMLISSAFIGGSEYRSSFDTVDVESAFFAAAGELGIPVQKKQVNPNIDYIATGKAEIGVLEMRIRSVKNPRINVHDMNFSRIALSCLSNNAHPNIMIESVNDALDIQNAPDALKESVISFIKEKNLDYFNFRLEGEPGGVHVSVSVALEEKEAWMDYLELLKRVVV